VLLNVASKREQPETIPKSSLLLTNKMLYKPNKTPTRLLI